MDWNISRSWSNKLAEFGLSRSSKLREFRTQENSGDDPQSSKNSEAQRILETILRAQRILETILRAQRILEPILRAQKILELKEFWNGSSELREFWSLSSELREF